MLGRIVAVQATGNCASAASGEPVVDHPTLTTVAAIAWTAEVIPSIWQFLAQSS